MSKIVDNDLVEAMAQGLKSNAWDKNKRYDSHTLEDIGLLYGVKLEGNETPIADRAHPETAVACPAYDAMNGVVENLYERQAIMKYVADKMPNGNLTQRRYVAAYNELMNSLIRTGFRMDDDGKVTLMKLSDSCAARLNKTAELKKEAILPLTIGLLIAGGVAAALGISAIINRTSNIAQGVSNDCTTTLKELEDLQGQPGIAEIAQDLNTLKNKADEFASLDKIPATNAQQVVDIAKNHPPQLKTGEEYVYLLHAAAKKIPGWIAEVKANAVAVKGQSKLPDWMAKVEEFGREALSITDDATDVVNALEGLQKSVNTAIGGVQVIMAKAKEYAPPLEQMLAEYKQEQQKIPSQTEAAPNPDLPPQPEPEAIG
jgi:hypothetical protein